MIKNNAFYPYFILLLVSFTWLIFRLPFPLINETHFLITELKIVDQNNFNYFYLFIKSPIFLILDYFFHCPFLCIIIAIFFNFFSLFLLFYLVDKINYNKNLSLLSVIILSPLSFAIFSIFSKNLLNFISLQDLNLYLLSPGPAYDFGHYILSNRIFLFIFHLLAIFFFLINKRFLFFIFLFLLNVTHANSGFVISLIFFISFILLSITHKKYLIDSVYVLILTILATLKKIIQIYNLNIDYHSISNRYWYEALIKAEDDFSILYQINYNFSSIFLIFLLSIVIIFFSRKIITKDFISKKLLILFILPILIFLTMGLFESFSIKMNFFHLIDPIINLQLGYKLISFSYIPLVFLLSKIFFYYFNKYKKYHNFFIFLFFVFSVFIIFSLVYKKNNLLLSSKIIYNAFKVWKINNILEYFEINGIEYNPSFTSIFYLSKNKKVNYEGDVDYAVIKKIDDINSTNLILDKYYEKYNKYEVFKEIVLAIKTYIPSNSGIIIPPYLSYFRDALTEYNIFFVKKHDGNIMMGHKKIAIEGLKRMKLLLRSDFTEMPSQHSRLQEYQIRKRYKNIDKNNLLNLQKHYPEFNFILTEKSHNINNADLIFSNRYYNLYKF